MSSLEALSAITISQSVAHCRRTDSTAWRR